MPGQQQQDADYVAPKDTAEARAQEFEEGQHDRAGHNKQAPSSQGKPSSVRQGGK